MNRLNSIHYQTEIFKDTSMTTNEAREWFNAVTLNDPNIKIVLFKIATGQYPRILHELDLFMKYLAMSKHNENGEALAFFVKNMNEETMLKLNLHRHDSAIVKILLTHPLWNDLSRLLAKKIDYEAWLFSCARAKQKRS